MMDPKDLLGIAAVLIFLGVVVRSIAKGIKNRRDRRKLEGRLLHSVRAPEERTQEREKNARKAIADLDEYYRQLFEGQDFVNKNARSLEEFVINEQLNHYDLHQLAHLNRTKLQMHSGWNDLVLDLIQELHAAGWNKRVGTIKEKFGELRFYADTEHDDLLDKYTEKSKSICEICGKPGTFYTVSAWDFTRCEEHKNI